MRKKQSIYLNEVAITGIGVVSPVGNSYKDLVNCARSAKSGIGPITQFDASVFGCKLAAEVKDFSIDEFGREVKRMDRTSQFAIVAAKRAFEDAKIKVPVEENCGAIIGSVAGGANSYESGHDALKTHGPKRVNPFCITRSISNMPSANVAIFFGLHGSNFAINTACSTSNTAIGHAYKHLRFQNAIAKKYRCDYIIAGGTDSCITPLGIAGFDAMMALTNDKMRPFDLNRSGFIIGEGCVLLVLETLEHALNRKAKIYAIIRGFGENCDAYHIAAPHPEGEYAAKCMQMALDDADLVPGNIGYINAHACATKAGDWAETKAIKMACGDAVYRIPVSSSKPLTGHLLAAAGAIESVFCIIALRDGIVVPTINYETPDPKCDLCYIVNECKQYDANFAMNNSFGFGGQNAVLIFEKYNDA